MTDIAPDTLRQIRLAEVHATSRQAKMKWLYARGWRRMHGDWENSRRERATFADAIALAVQAELEDS